MIDLAYGRLQQSLLVISETMHNNEPSSPILCTSVVLDAWAIIDSVHRLSDLVEHFPNLHHRNRVPAIRDLFEANRVINQLRNTVQHLAGQIREANSAPNWSVWGALGWCVPPPTDDEPDVLCGLYFCGRVEAGSAQPFVNPLGKRIHRPVGAITLTQTPDTVCLSDVFEIVQRFTSTFEESLAASYRADARLAATVAADVLLIVSMRLADEAAPF